MILINITKPVGHVIIWNGGVFRIPHKLILANKDEFERFKIMAQNFKYEYEILKGIEVIEDTQPQEEEVSKQEVNEETTYETSDTNEVIQETTIEIDIDNLHNLKKSELIEIAKELDIDVSDKTKKQLIEDIKGALNK